MKKLLMLAVLAAAFTACLDDDAVSEINHLPVEQAILGKWYPQGGTVNGGSFTPYEDNDCTTLKDYQEFVNNTVKFVGYNEACENDETSVSAYNINGNTLVVEDEFFGDQEFTITSLTAQQLILTSTGNTPDGVQTVAAYFSRN